MPGVKALEPSLARRKRAAAFCVPIGSLPYAACGISLATGAPTEALTLCFFASLAVPSTVMVLKRKELLRRKAEYLFLLDESKRDILSKGITRGRLIVLGYTALPVAFLCWSVG